MLQLVKYIYFSIAFIIASLIVIKSLNYINPDFTRGFLSDKEDIFGYYRPFLYMHMIGAPVALLTGLFQFTFNKNRYHKYLGRTYLIAVIFFAAPAGFVMAFYAIGGIWSIVNFTLLSALWLYFSIVAFKFIRRGDVEKHRQFMIRSFILANSAILIRMLSYLNNHFHFADVATGYLAISWISWAPGLVFYEVKLMLTPYRL